MACKNKPFRCGVTKARPLKPCLCIQVPYSFRGADFTGGEGQVDAEGGTVSGLDSHSMRPLLWR